jgi:aminoglycoside 2''-phosphotransferase
VGYEKIIGEELTREILMSNEAIFESIANFITQLHSFSLERARGSGVETMDLHEHYSNLLKRVLNLSLLDNQEKKYFDDFFHSYLADKTNFDYQPVLSHADLSPNHVIIDSKKLSVEGIIDFGDLRLTDPAYDYLYLFRVDQGGSLKKFLTKQENILADMMLRKLKFFSRANWFEDIFYGLENQENETLTTALSEVKKYARLG